MKISSEVTASARLDLADDFRHEALFYVGLDGFVEGTSAFIKEGLEAGEPTLVVAGAYKLAALRAELGKQSDLVQFADMSDVGLNPARIIPAWVDFLAHSAPDGRRVRGIGDPIWAERSSDELIECQRHESLLNIAFADSPAWWLLCPYDIGELRTDVLDEARRSHPFLWEDGAHTDSSTYRDLETAARPFDAPLPPRPAGHQLIILDVANLRHVRDVVARAARSHGLDEGRAADLVLSVNELAGNSLRHGGGSGSVRIWTADRMLICEIEDAGHIDKPLAGRERPLTDRENGFGLWLVNQLCDLVQVRTFKKGTVVRLHMARA
ncbi:MAG TPA: sensor histidine kinase [Actinomycetota bacterium]|nr:sensor histidine kinase [Actinomycetota bacterium]